MRYLFIILLLSVAGMGVFSCSKYQDKKAVQDPRLTRHYCNDPSAVNYNWDFPGIADNTVCFYPTDVFKGVYEFHDSVFLKSTGYFLHADTFVLTINKQSSTKFTITGLCSSGQSLALTAGVNYYASLDTLIGDTTTTIRGQMLCTPGDTVNGVLTKDRINDSLLYLTLVVAADTGVTTTHTGTAKLKYK